MLSETWEEVAPMPATPRQYCTTFTILDTGYVFGGLDGDGALNELWAYSPTTGWVQKASLPAEERYACVGQEGLYSGVIATGMLAGGGPTNEAWKYWPGSNEWEQLADVPGPPRHRAAATRVDGGMMVCGGADIDFIALGDCWRYPLFFEVGEWFEEDPMPASRYGHRGAGHRVVIGGASDTFEMHDDVWTLSFAPVQLSAFGGGPRRGGIGFGKTHTPYINTLYFGLGIGPDGEDFVRYNDWWKLTYPVGIGEHSSTDITLFPNPATDRITLELSDQWTNATASIHDALGRIVQDSHVPLDGVLHVKDLAPGRYEVIITGADQRTLRKPFIKLE